MTGKRNKTWSEMAAAAEREADAQVEWSRVHRPHIPDREANIYRSAFVAGFLKACAMMAEPNPRQ